MDSRETAPTSSTHLRSTAPAKAHVCDDHVVQEGPDVLGSEREPREPLPRWVRLLAVGATGLAVAGWVAVPHFRHRPPTPAAPTPSRTDAVVVRDAEHCGPPGRDGMAWSAPQVGELSDGRVALATVLACNTGPRPATVLSLRAAGRGRADLRPQDYAALTGSGGPGGPPGTVPLPARVPAGGRATVMSASVLLDCTDVAATLPPLRAEVRLEGGDTHTDAIFSQQDTGLGSSWCGRSPAISLERIGPLTVTVDRSRRTIDLEVGLLNPNAEPIQLAGIGSPSPGVRVLVDNLHGRAVPAGSVVTATARFLVERCGSVFVDGPWSLPAMALGAVPARPVRLSTSPWQLAAVRTLCPTRHPLRQAHAPAVLEVTDGGVGSSLAEGGLARLDLSMQVLNAGRRPLVLTRREVPVPGAALTAVSVQTGDGGQGLVEPLTRFSLPVGASATVTMTYEAPTTLTDDCGLRATDGWPAPVGVSDAAGRPQVAKLVGGVPDVGGPGWIGSWLLSSQFGCPPQQSHRGADPPFLFVDRPMPLSGKHLPLTLFGLPGLPAATVVSVRAVGASADLGVLASRLPSRIAPGQAVSLPLTLGSCPDGTNAVRVAVNYRVPGRTGIPPPLLVDLPGCGLR